VLDSEMGGAFEFDTISLKRHSSGSTSGQTTFADFEIWAGLAESDVLGDNFEDNFIPGTRTLLFSRESLLIEAEPNAWIPFVLDSPFWYGGTKNLIIEILWSEGEELGTECVYTWQWNTGTMRCASGPYDSETGSRTSVIPLIQFSGDMTLLNTTFAGVKTSFQ